MFIFTYVTFLLLYSKITYVRLTCMLFMFAIQSGLMLFMFVIQDGLIFYIFYTGWSMLFIFAIQGGRMLFMFAIQDGKFANKDWRR